MPFCLMADGHASHDQQVHVALECLLNEYPHLHLKIQEKFPELENDGWKWEPLISRIDHEAMGVDPEFTSWLADALEELEVIEWRDGELWVWFSGP